MDNTIKIGRKEHLIKKGDYILFNGACYQFCAGDGRTLERKRWNTYSSLRIPKTTVKKLTLDKMTKEESISYGVNIIKWFF